ncbi:helix-turn-helix transcriptional regulator [Salegentibacter sp. UBA1130]|uniref:helix-turn-helix transcriptional regulator n=1 Tax=Salegentibacter sp. UBA1130 TaxID=1947451 RepID=UPI002580F6FE|nr:AraC family transcriptional regulator [Salegentibacter sp. UBA1130]
MTNTVHIDRDFGWFVGSFENNQQHKHYAVQLSIPINGKVILKTKDGTFESEQPILIKSNVAHQIISNTRQFLLLINPASTIGHFWNHLSDKEIQEINLTPALELRRALIDTNPQQVLAKELNSIIEKHDCFCSSAIHKGDERINNALVYLSNHFDRVVSLDEIADHFNVSSSRFLHLFKEETGITYRRAQLWNKLIKGITQFGKKSFTEIALGVGFSDNAHFSRVFKENFGFSPLDFLKISQFVQV